MHLLDIASKYLDSSFSAISGTQGKGLFQTSQMENRISPVLLTSGISNTKQANEYLSQASTAIEIIINKYASEYSSNIENTDNAPPQFDATTHCNHIANISGSTSEIVRSGCLEQEQESYNKIKSIWKTIPTATKDQCTNVAKTSEPGSYIVLDGCIEQEIQSKRANESFQFKY